MKYKKNVISNLILHVLSIGIGFVTSILIARSLGPENQGQLSYYVLIFGLIATYGHLGVNSSTSYFLKKTNFKREDITNTNISMLIILDVLYIVAIILFRNILFSSYVYGLLAIWIIYTTSLLFSNFLITIYISEEKIYVYNRFLIFIQILKGVVITILYFANTLNIITISMLYAATEIIKLILLLRGLKLSYRPKVKIKVLKEELKYGIPLYFAALFIYLNYRVDQLMVKQYLGNNELGIYSISVTLAELAFIFPESISSAFEGRLYSCKEEERRPATMQTVKLAFYLTTIICIIGICCKPLVSILYGLEYERAGITMVILLIGIAFASIGKVVPAYFYTSGRPKIHFRVSAIVLIINLTFNLLLIPKIGINGAAIASTIGYIFYGMIYLVLLKKEGFSIKELLYIRRDEIERLRKYVYQKIQGGK